MEIKFIGKCLFVGVEGKKILVVGDLHLGYEELLNQAGVFVTRQMFKEMINYFDRVFEKVGNVNEIVLLGDVKHDFGGIVRQEWSDVLGLFDYFGRKLGKRGKIIITKGNHDTILEPIVKKREKVKLLDYFISDGFCFLHGNRDFAEIHDKKIKYWVIGHAHPAVRLSDKIKNEKYKSFLVGKYKGKKIIIMPSFFDYTEGSDPRENYFWLPWRLDLERFDVKIVSDEKDLEVLDFGTLKDLK